MFPFLSDFVRSLQQAKPARPICCDTRCAMSIPQSRSFRCKHLPSMLIRTWTFGLFAPAPGCSPFLGDWRLVWPSLVSTESKRILWRDAYARSGFAWRLARGQPRSCDLSWGKVRSCFLAVLRLVLFLPPRLEKYS